MIVTVVVVVVSYILLDFLYVPVKLVQLVKISLFCPPALFCWMCMGLKSQKRSEVGDVLCFIYALFTLPKCSLSHRINKYEILTVLNSVNLLHVF